MNAALSRLRILSSAKPYCPHIFATANAVTHLANSAGCRLTGPSEIQEREPLISFAMKGVTSRSTIVRTYRSPVSWSKYWSSMSKMISPITSAKPIHTICFPERVAKSKKSVSPISWLAPQMENHPKAIRSRYTTSTTQSAERMALRVNLSFLFTIIYCALLHRISLKF